MSLINHSELSIRLGMQLKETKPYPPKHKGFIESLKELLEKLITLHKSNPEQVGKVINQLNKKI